MADSEKTESPSYMSRAWGTAKSAAGYAAGKVGAAVDSATGAVADNMVKYTPGLAHAVVNAGNWLEEKHALERSIGTAQAIGSGAAAYATAPLALTGYGAVVPAYFADQAIAGARTAYEGEFVDAFGHQALDAAGMPILATAYDFADVLAGVPALMKGGYKKLLDMSRKMAGESGSFGESLGKLLSEGISSGKFSLDDLKALRKTLTDPEEIAAVDKAIADAEAKAAKDGVTATKSGEGGAGSTAADTKSPPSDGANRGTTGPEGGGAGAAPGGGEAGAGAAGGEVPKGSPGLSEPAEPYNRRDKYGNTPTKSDRQALGAGPDQVVDHDPPLVKRYYEGDPTIGEKPGYQMTQAERKAGAARAASSP